jgi:hypothetical protein
LIYNFKKNNREKIRKETLEFYWGNKMKKKKEIGIFLTLVMIIAAVPLVGGESKADVTLDVIVTTDFVNGWQDYGLRIKEYGVDDEVWLYAEFSSDDLFGINMTFDYYYDHGEGLTYRFSWWWVVDGHYESAYFWAWETMGQYYGPGYGYIEAFADGEYLGESNFYAMGNNQPDMPTITGPTEGVTGEATDYTFTATDPDGFDIYLLVDWGDDSDEMFGPIASGDEITESHTYAEDGDYTISCIAKDLVDNESDAATLVITMPKTKSRFFGFNLFERILEQFPNAFPLLRLLREI